METCGIFAWRAAMTSSRESFFFSGSAADSLNFFTAWKLLVEKYIKNPIKN